MYRRPREACSGAKAGNTGALADRRAIASDEPQDGGAVGRQGLGGTDIYLVMSRQACLTWLRGFTPNGAASGPTFRSTAVWLKFDAFVFRCGGLWSPRRLDRQTVRLEARALPDTLHLPSKS
jgi:hypothetical protein